MKRLAFERLLDCVDVGAPLVFLQVPLFQVVVPWCARLKRVIFLMIFDQCHLSRTVSLTFLLA